MRIAIDTDIIKKSKLYLEDSLLFLFGYFDCNYVSNLIRNKNKGLVDKDYRSLLWSIIQL